MKTAPFGIALVSYLLGAIAMYAYYNRNNYIDIVFAAFAAFIFGASMLLASFSVVPKVSSLLVSLSEVLILISVILLILRLGQVLTKKLNDFLSAKRQRRKNDSDSDS